MLCPARLAYFVFELVKTVYLVLSSIMSGDYTVVTFTDNRTALPITDS